MGKEKQHKKRSFLFNPLKRPLPYLGIMLGILLLVFQRTIRNYVSDSIGEILVNSVQEATGGEYKITYDLVRFDVISRELRLSNFSIELDTAVISKEDYLVKKPNLIDIKTPLVVVKLRSILPLLFKDQLLVSFVGAREPEFSLVRSMHSSALKSVAKKSQKDAAEVIKNYFAALEIDSFRIESGSFSIESEDKATAEIPNIHVSEFTTMIKNFRLDSLSPSILLQGVSATTLELEIRKQNIYLPKQNQNIYFERLHLSSVESLIEVDSLVVKNTTKIDNKSYTDIKIPTLKLLGFDFEEAFNKNNLDVKAISIENPQIRLKTVSNTQGKQKTSPSFYKYFHKLKIDTINFKNGLLGLESKQNSTIQDLSFKLTNYTITKEDWENKKLISDINVISLNANHIEQQLPDSIHKAEIERVFYNRSTNKIVASKVKIRPISGRNSYRSLQSRNINFSAYSTIGTIQAWGFKPKNILLNKPITIDTVVIENPRASILQYPLMRTKKVSKGDNTTGFNIKQLITTNGSFKVRQYKKGQSTLSQFNGVNINLQNLSPQSLRNGIPKSLKLYSSDGSFELKGIGHTISYTNATTMAGQSAFAESISIKPDSATLPYNQIKGQLNNLYINNIDVNNLAKGMLKVDTIVAKSGQLSTDFTRQKFENEKKINTIDIKKVSIGNTDIAITLKESYIEAKGVSFETENIIADSLITSNNPSFEFSNSLVSYQNLKFSDKADTSVLSIGSGFYDEKDSTIIAKNISFNKPNNTLNFNLQEAELKAFNKAQLLYQDNFHFSKAILIKPEIIINGNKRNGVKRSINLQKKLLSGKIQEISFDTLDIYNGSSTIKLANSSNELSIGTIDGVIRNFKADTLATIEQSINNLNGVFEFGSAKMQGKKDTLIVHKIFLNAQSKNIWTDSIHYNKATSQRVISLASPGIAVQNISLPSLLQNTFSIKQIASRNNHITIRKLDTISQVSSQKTPEFSLPINLLIGGVNIKNTQLNYLTPSTSNHFLNKLRFDIELDSISGNENTKFELSEATKDARLRVYDFSLNLPDSLNKLGFDTLLVSNRKSEIRISNLRMTPLYPKYEYANRVGFQADWKKLVVNEIAFKKIDFKRLIEDKSFLCQKVLINDGQLDLFKDKQLPFPSERIMPMLQERIKKASIALELDSIEIKNIDISQTTLQSSGLTEGSITFQNTNGLITNITNDSSRLHSDRILKVGASTQIMGKGNLTANFAFDMLDPNNLFFFDARLGPMEAKEFNNILEATAFVKVKSGNIKSINLQATANSSYAYGNMSFLYNNLKVEAYNKKNLKTKGMGVTLKSFFANTFVVKKNNSKYRLLGRRGTMFYERDPARISLDYAAKTALSGVVSSIGARNNSKEIKRIQKEQKQMRDAELKQKKDQQKAAKKLAK